MAQGGHCSAHLLQLAIDGRAFRRCCLVAAEGPRSANGNRRMQVCEVLQLQDQSTLISENAIEMHLTPPHSHCSS